MAGRKVFVGSLPQDIEDGQLRSAFAQYGTIEDVFVKRGCEPGRQWAFVTFTSPQEALLAKESCDRVLTFPGHDKPVEVMLARNQGMFGQAQPQDSISISQPLVVTGHVGGGPRKIFVGSLPDRITEETFREEFGKFGDIVDVFLKTGCETGRQWGFITYATHEQAQRARQSADRTLVVPGADRPCECMMARNQGIEEKAPPPPLLPVMTPWRCYYTNTGIPYYHNHTTGVTQWECPLELQVPQWAPGPYAAMPIMAAHSHYAPY